VDTFIRSLVLSGQIDLDESSDEDTSSAKEVGPVEMSGALDNQEYFADFDDFVGDSIRV